MNKEQTQKYLGDLFDNWFVPSLQEFVRCPNLTPMVDKEYLTNGLMDQAIEIVDKNIQKLEIQGLKREIIKKDGSPPLVVYIVESEDPIAKNVMLYGHIDKQPWFTGWREGLHPTDPVIEGDLMYGRGSSDDGYAAFSSMLAVKNIQEQKQKLPRIALCLELEEESGSPNLVDLLQRGESVIKKPDVLLCMDSGCLDYEQLWVTSSLRGICIVDLTVETGLAGYHSGETGGIVPETFRVIRDLLNRLDDPVTGKVCQELQVEAPEWKQKEAEKIAALKKEELYNKYPMHEGVKAVEQENLVEMYLNNVWRPNLSITGAEGLPEIQTAGNVLRPATSVRCSMRLSPGIDAKKAN